MIYRITWGDRFRAAWGRVPSWARFLLLAIALVAGLLLASGCTDAPAPRGTAIEAAADANARAASNARAADSAAIAAAEAKARADQLTAEAKAKPTEDRIQKATDARVDAAAKEAVAKALDEQSQKATAAAEHAQIAAHKERDAEARAAADLAWTHLCRVIGLIGVAAGALIGGLLCYLTKSIAPGAPVGGIIAGTGMFVVAYGSTVAWAPIVLAGTVVAGLIVWAMTHQKETAVKNEALRFGDDATSTLEALGHKAEAEAVKAQAVSRQVKSGLQDRIDASLQSLRPKWAVARNQSP